MNLRKISTRAVVAGATTALAAGALVATATAPANAATVSNTYTCDIAIAAMSYDMTLEVSGELPVPQYWAGADVPAGLLAVEVTSEVDPAIAGMLGEYGVTHARSDDFSIDLGSATVPVPVEGDFVAEGETTTWEAAGSNEPFVTPNPGMTDGLLPAAFTFTAETTAFGDFPIPCALAEGETAQTLASIELLKQSSETVGKNVKAKKGKKAVLPVSVSSTSLGGPVDGKVVAKEGKKTLGSGKLKNGTVKLNLGKKLKPGKHKITVKYTGIPSVGASSDKVTVTVKKK